MTQRRKYWGFMVVVPYRWVPTVAAIGIGAPRVRLVATTDTLAYCLSGDVAQEC